jgi:hypothetical protein
MATCEQSSGQTILQHGESVAATFKDMYGPNPSIILPEIIQNNLAFLLSKCPSAEILETYHIYHDCGKPDCLIVDADGKRHFPCHAMASARAWLVAGGDQFVGRLIEHDMDMHTLKVADLASYRHMDIAPALLLTAWAELNSNARMFGGIESISFKIKAKSLTKLSRAIITTLKETS